MSAYCSELYIYTESTAPSKPSPPHGYDKIKWLISDFLSHRDSHVQVPDPSVQSAWFSNL